MAERIGAPPSDREWIRKLEKDLAECYRLTGSDPDGDSDSMLAQHAVQAVRELREENERVGEWEERAVSAERQLGALLSAVDELVTALGFVHRDPVHRLYAAADQIRKERGE